MKLSQDQINDWLNANCSANTATNYRQRINPTIRELNEDNLVPEIKSKKVLQVIVDKYTSPSTIKGAAQVFLKLIAQYPGLKEEVGEKVYEVYRKFFMEANNEMSNGYIQKAIVHDKKDDIERFSKIKEMVYKAFPDGSDERLYMDFYEIAPVRDDFGELHIVEKVAETKDKEKNYYVVSTHKLIINEYKKAERHGQLVYKLPKKVWSKIDTSKPLVFNHGKQLTHWVSKMLKTIGVEGAINTLRHSYLSEQLDGENIKDPKIRRELFERMAHSASTQLQYLRGLKELE